ncbi:hypothetical protein Tco_0456455, partial [Tanacetum coccineum]
MYHYNIWKALYRYAPTLIPMPQPEGSNVASAESHLREQSTVIQISKDSQGHKLDGNQIIKGISVKKKNGMDIAENFFSQKYAALLMNLLERTMMKPVLPHHGKKESELLNPRLDYVTEFERSQTVISAMVQDGKVVVQDVRGRYNANNQGRPFQRNNARGNGVAGNVTNIDDDVDDSTENDLALNVDHIFEADECDAFDSDVDEGPTSQTMFIDQAVGKLRETFCRHGYQWRPTGKKLTLGKLDCGSQWRPTGKKFALGEIYHLTKLSVKCRTGHALVSGLRLLKTYDGESFKAHEFYGKVHRCDLKSVGQFCDYDLEVAFRKHTCFVRDIKGTDILK